MAAPSIPSNFVVQTGNGVVYLSWSLTAGATEYGVQRSEDGITFTTIGTSVSPNYTDSDVTVRTEYYYKVCATNADGNSPYTVPQMEIPTLVGTVSLFAMRRLAQQMADRVGSNFVSKAEWNTYINQSATGLYDMLTTEYEDYFLAGPYTFRTNGTDAAYPMPDGSAAFQINGVKAPAFYKLLGVDVNLDGTGNARVTLHKFDFVQRNRYVYPNVTSSALGVFNMKYRLMGNSLRFMPTPASGQVVQVWYVPRLDWLLKDTDIFDSISGWHELICVDAAIKALTKEESDTSALEARKASLMERIVSAAMNRDAGEPDTISPSRTNSTGWGGFGDSSSGGW